MENKARDEYLDKVDIKSLPRKRFRTYSVVLLLSLFVLCGCGGRVVYKDDFDSTPIGVPPGPPEIGTSSVDGDVLIAENPINDVSPDRWLQLKRNQPFGVQGLYDAMLKEPMIEGGNVALVGYIPSWAPVRMEVYFETPDIPLPPSGRRLLLHIDLLRDGNIRLNDSTNEGTYEFDTSIAFLVGFDLDASPPTATVLVKGGGEDASTTVEISSDAAEFGLDRVRFNTDFGNPDFDQGRFFINEVVATRSSD